VTDALALARQWRAVDPDADTQAELDALMAGPADALAARFIGRLQFGTAGLRGALGAGPLRMNRVLVRQAASGLGQFILHMLEDGAQRGVAIGFDARRNSEVFALDTARVFAAMGIRSYLLPSPLPTPVLASVVVERGTAMGVMVTASHNPPADNGYKVFQADGSQIVSPTDELIATRIDAINIAKMSLADADHTLITRLSYEESTAMYLRRVPYARLVPEVGRGVVAAYTAMHGVGRDTLLAAFDVAGLDAPHVEPTQAEPDGTFPTVPFPNPEEPGAMDRVIALASSVNADVAIANDPDADRLGAAIPTPAGWRRLQGDEIGWLLADHILRHTSGDDRLVVTTLVSSSLLADMAAAYGVHCEETFTGFKWIGHVRRTNPAKRFMLGYEQALGYLVVDRPNDKDGITAAVMLVEMAACAKRDGVTLADRLDDIAARFGKRVIADRSVPLDPVVGSRRVAAMRANPPKEIAGHAVTSVSEFPEANLLRFQCGPNLRLQVRPSGTEPKVKLYAEATGLDPTEALAALADFLTHD
jgi:phosphomannomutase